MALSCPNAWSPREGILATMLVLPCHEGGYDLGPITLNQRLTADSPAITSLRSRVPDISFHQAPIGLNYDGREHLALSLLERTAMEVGLHPGDGSAFQELRSVRGAIRRKYVDDRRRDRDLATMGLETMVVTSEDMDDIRSLDLLMLQVIARIEHHVGIHLWEQRTCIDDPRCTARRQEVLAHLGARARQKLIGKRTPRGSDDGLAGLGGLVGPTDLRAREARGVRQPHVTQPYSAWTSSAEKRMDALSPTS